VVRLQEVPALAAIAVGVRQVLSWACTSTTTDASPYGRLTQAAGNLSTAKHLSGTTRWELSDAYGPSLCYAGVQRRFGSSIRGYVLPGSGPTRPQPILLLVSRCPFPLRPSSLIAHIEVTGWEAANKSNSSRGKSARDRRVHMHEGAGGQPVFSGVLTQVHHEG